MSNIDKLLTEAALRDVKTFDFDLMLEGINTDIDQQREMLKRYNVKEDKTLNTMINKEEQLRLLAREWKKAVELDEYRDCRIVILLEAA